LKPTGYTQKKALPRTPLWGVGWSAPTVVVHGRRNQTSVGRRNWTRLEQWYRILLHKEGWSPLWESRAPPSELPWALGLCGHQQKESVGTPLPAPRCLNSQTSLPLTSRCHYPSTVWTQITPPSWHLILFTLPHSKVPSQVTHVSSNFKYVSFSLCSWILGNETLGQMVIRGLKERIQGGTQRRL
jgi:hypothetical protein